jgi:hypothetical protein
MTSGRRLRANRVNAKSSTGPKTIKGKARAAQNAFRHGLNISVASSLEDAPEIESLTLRLAGVDPNDEVIELARKVSEAQADLNRVRAVRRQFVLNRFDVRLPVFNPVKHTVRPNAIAGDDRLAAILAESEFARLDRCERRALSRRKFAIRQLDKRVRSG